MTIWFTEPTPEAGNEIHRGTIVDQLGIRFAHVGDDFIVGTMPVDYRTLQVNGILHGGASVTLAETLGSYGANSCVDQEKYYCVAIDVNANHIRQTHKGSVTGMARPIHIGSKTHVWRIEINDANDQPICESRLTIAVIERDQ